MITITKALPTDNFGIRNVQKLTWLDTYPNEKLGISYNDIYQRFALDNTPAGKKRIIERGKLLNQNNSQTWVAKEKDKIVGFATVTWQEKENNFGGFYILPSHQRQGIGSQFMEVIFNWLNNKNPIHLHVAKYNTKAIRFYEKFGFIKTNKKVQSSVAILPSGAIIPEIEMVKTF